ncbi:MAG: DMT family transporter [Rhizobiaceae bacterium]
MLRASMTGTAARLPAVSRSAWLATFAIVLAAIGFGAVPFFVRGLAEAGLSPVAIALSRYALTAILLSAFVIRLRRDSAILWALGTGLAIGLGWIGYVEALRHAPVATVGVFYMSYPLFALVAAWLLLAQRPSWQSVLAGGLILLAAAIALSPASVDASALPFLLLSLAAPLTFGAGIAILTGKLMTLSALERVFYTTLGASLGLLPLMLWETAGGDVVFSIDGYTWLLLAGLALATAFIPQLLFVIAAPMVGAARTAAAGSVELPVMFVVGWMAFGEALDGWQLAAGLLVMAAIVLTPPLAPPAAVTPAVAKTG